MASIRTTRRRGLALPLLLLLAGAGLACETDTADRTEAGADTTTAGAAADTQTIRVDDAGLQTPEAVIHDDQADVYLVSNINGDPLDKDGNGFISRVGPDGNVAELRWIDGEAEDVTLHAPKGMALKGDTLFVADIDSVRMFDRSTGEARGARGVEGATFLNAIAVAPDGSVYVSDTGMGPGFEPSGADAIHRLGADEVTAVARGEGLSHPNGITFADGDLVMVPFGGNQIRRIPVGGGAAGASQAEEPGQPDQAAGEGRAGQTQQTGQPGETAQEGQEGQEDGIGTVIATLPGGQLDGVVRLDDGALLVSSWEASAVFRVHTNGEAHVETIVEGVPSPAAIGYDRQRQRLLIPVFNENRLEFRPVR